MGLDRREETHGGAELASRLIPSFRHVPALDGLRGISVVAVLLYHAGYMAGGYLGVDAFFVLSGFLITSLLLIEQAGASSISVTEFWARRVRRLLPALLSLLALVVAYALVIARPDELPALRLDALASIGYFANWHAIYGGADYFASFRSPSILKHTWSLSIEEQFYFIWPVLVAVTVRGRNAFTAAMRVLVVAGTLASISYFAMANTYSILNPARGYYGTDTRAGALLLGAALAAGLQRFGAIRGRLLPIVRFASIAAIGWLAREWSTRDGRDPFLYRGGMLLSSVAVVILVAAVSDPGRSTVMARFFSAAPLRWFGRLSYGLYLWHWPIFVYLDAERTGLNALPLLTLRLVVTVFVAYLSYTFIEMPMRVRVWSRARTYSFSGVTVVALCVAIIAATSVTALPTRTSGAYPQIIPNVHSKSWQNSLRKVREATAGLPRNATNVVVTGDSTSIAMGSRPRYSAPTDTIESGWGLIGCSIIDAGLVAENFAQIQNPACKDWFKIYDDLFQAMHPNVVVLMLGPWELFDRQVDGVKVAIGSPHFADIMTAQLEKELAVISRASARMLLVTTPCYEPTNAATYQAETWTSRLRIEALNRIWRDFATAHKRDVTLGDLGRFVCPKGTVRRSFDGSPLRSDGIHFTRSGAETIWQWLRTQIEAMRVRGLLPH